MNLTRTGVMFALLGALATTATPSDVGACGGCFTGPTTVQVVTDHRMVLSVSGGQTTLWDQFQYSGSPADFSWILPIRYTERTQVALADDGFMRMADSLTAPIVTPPNNPCPGRFAAAGGNAAPPPSAADAGADSGVTVLRQEVIGPYAVSIIRGTNPMAVREWLQMNGYTVPPAVEPIIDHYTAMSMDYVALRLRPGEGVNRMSPVRVTVEGLMPSLPLRMIAAGVADRVGLSLVVLASSRYEAMNFPNGEIREADLTWDFASPTNPASDFLAAFNSLNRSMGDRLWLTESATAHTQQSWLDAAPGFRGAAVSTCPPGVPGCTRPMFPDAGPPADAGEDGGDGGAGTDPADDVRVAFAGLGDRATVTRLRANLLATMLTQDLRLAASDRGERSRNYTYGRRLNEPSPTCNGTINPGTTTPPGGTTTPPSDGGVSCAATPTRAGDDTTFLATLLGLAAAGLGLRARRR
ncbi:MAG: DUF2330 domain-containing protein [Polyangiales bacterium]